MHLSGISAWSCLLAAFLIGLGLVPIIQLIWQRKRKPSSQPESFSDRRYLRVRGSLRLATGLLLIICGVLLAYIGLVPMDQLDLLIGEITQSPERAQQLRTPDNTQAITQAVILVTIVGGCALLLIMIALAELVLTWLHGLRKQFELHQARQAYLAQQAIAAQQARQASTQSSN